MPVYAFKGRNRSNEVVVGERFAPDRQTLENLLRREQIVVNSIKEKGKEVAIPKLGRRQKVSAKELAIFTRQFSVMIDAGLPLVQCLDILGNQQPNNFFKQTLLQVRTDVESGMTLAESMSRHPKVFESLYVNMVAAGETGGILDLILQRLSIYIEKIVKLKSDIVSASIYPLAVIGLAVVVVAIIMVVVIPAFKNIFEGLLGPGEALPLPTEIVITISDFMAGYWWIVLIAIGGTSYAFKSYYATTNGRRVIDNLLLKAPIFGDILRKVAVARFSRTLATLLSSGVPILESLDITGRTAGNIIIQEGIMKIRAGIEQGQTIVEPLKASNIFPPMVAQMIGVGEQTGALDTMLGKIADFYEQEVDAAVANLLTLLEPIMIVFLGVTIGSIVISMYLPLFVLIGRLAGKQ